MRGYAKLEKAGRQRLATVSAGVGLKLEHADAILDGGPRVDFFEIHAENFMGAGGPPHHLLHRIRADHPLSIHGVGLSIGGAAPLDRAHLRRLRRLIDIYRPAAFSEHLAWSTHEGVFLNDLLPLPYNERTLALVCDHVDQTQDAIGMRLLLENPATYLALPSGTMGEIAFLKAIVARTGCGLLLDVNNVHVCAVNHGFDAADYIDAFPIEQVGEMHLAGFAEDRDGAGATLLIDDHGRPVSEAVWALYRRVLASGCLTPTLVEWDNDVPAYPMLAAEAMRARMALTAQAAQFEDREAA